MKGCNIILHGTHEYRPPKDIQEVRRLQALGTHPTNGVVKYESRFVGLVVIPGHQQKYMILEQNMKDPTAEAPLGFIPNQQLQQQQQRQQSHGFGYYPPVPL